MRKISITAFGLLVSISFFSCGSSQTNAELAEEIKAACLENETNKIIYKEDLEDFCNCIDEKILALPEDTKADDEKLADFSQQCADNFTSLDINF